MAHCHTSAAFQRFTAYISQEIRKRLCVPVCIGTMSRSHKEGSYAAIKKGWVSGCPPQARDSIERKSQCRDTIWKAPQIPWFQGLFKSSVNSSMSWYKRKRKLEPANRTSVNSSMYQRPSCHGPRVSWTVCCGLSFAPHLQDGVWPWFPPLCSSVERSHLSRMITHYPSIITDCPTCCYLRWEHHLWCPHRYILSTVSALWFTPSSYKHNMAKKIYCALNFILAQYIHHHQSWKTYILTLQ